MTPERLAELRRIAEAATPGPWEVTEFAGGEERSPGELGVFAPNHPHSYQKSDGTWYAVVICRGMDGPTREENSEYIATFDPPTVLAMLDEIERLRREVHEWMCDGCNTVYPDPPQPGIWCVQCPRCGGDTAPRGAIERRRLEREIERLRRERETLAAAVMGWQRYLERDVGTEIVHVRTLEAHGRALALLDGEKGGGDDGR